jgi:SAM-dependent methyltransferase
MQAGVDGIAETTGFGTQIKQAFIVPVRLMGLDCRQTTDTERKRTKFNLMDKQAMKTAFSITGILAILVTVIFNGCADRRDAGISPAITAIQKDIARADKSEEAYYWNSYAPVEPRYWSKIAAWMVEDSIERTYVRKQTVNGILDLGCGYGTLLSFAAGVYGTKGTCFDVVPYLQPEIQQKYNLQFVEGNIEKDAFPEGRLFDVVIMTEVLEHLNFQPVPTLKKVYDSLNEDGTFFLSTPDADAGWGRTTKYYPAVSEIPAVDPNAKWIDDHIWQYNREELEGVLHEAGFKIKKIDLSDGVQGKHFNVWAVKISGN